MKYLDFEKHIKNELVDSKEAVQMDSLLTSLNLGKKDPKQKGFAFWMFLPFLLLAISFVAWKFMNTKTNSGSNSYLSEDVSTKTDKGTFQASNTNSEGNNSSIIYSDQDLDKNTTEIDNEGNVISRNHTENNFINNKNNQINTSSTISTTTNNSIKTNSTNTFKSENQNSDSKLSNQSFKSSGYNSSSPKNQEPLALSVFNKDNYPTALASDKLEIKNARNLMSVADLSSSVESLKENEVDGNLFKRMKINCPSFDNSGWHIALIPEIGLFHPIKTLENNNAEESVAFNERLKSETTLEGIELGLSGMLVRDNVPFYLKVGLSYARISERMELKYEYSVMDTTIGIISSTVSANGDTITHIYGDIVTETTFKGSNRQHHYIHLFDIPISVGYSTYLGGLDIGIEAGIKVNFMTRATGNLLTSENGYTNLSLNKLFKNRVGIGYIGGLMIGRNFGRFGDIYIAPRFTYYPNNFNNQHNSINQKYFNVGLHAGIVYKIN